jgi:hypothetical protein
VRTSEATPHLGEGVQISPFLRERRGDDLGDPIAAVVLSASAVSDGDPGRGQPAIDSPLRAHRLALGLTGQQAAARAGVSLTGYFAAEKPGFDARSRQTGDWKDIAERIARALWQLPEDLFPQQPADLDDRASGLEVSSWSTDAALPADALFDAKELATEARLAVDSLDPRRRRCVARWTGLDGEEAETHAAIGAREGVSGARVREIVCRALGRLRLRAERRNLNEFWIRTARDERRARRTSTPYPVIYCVDCERRSRLSKRLTGEEIEERIRVGELRCECGRRPSHVKVDYWEWVDLRSRGDVENDATTAEEGVVESVVVEAEPVPPPPSARPKPVVRTRPMARTANFSDLSRDDLLVAVQDLVARKRITVDEVRTAAERPKRIAALEAELARLRGEGARRSPGRPRGAARPARVARDAAATTAPVSKRRITNTPKRAAALKRQGQYMAALAKLTGADRARVKGVAKQDGVPAAIALAARLLK